MKTPKRRLKAREKLGKYTVLRRVGEGAFASVYEALDTVEGVRVALKVPHPHRVTRESLEWFKQEARVHAALDHPSILPVKNAEFLDGHFIIVYTLGERSLADRLKRRLSVETFLDFADQMLGAVAHAHAKSVIHCDLKPQNFILFADNRLRLADFTLAKIAAKTVIASGSGTVGYMAPEQAMGRASFRSDVFSLGLIFYQMLAGVVPQWPFDWPPPGFPKLRRKVPAELIDLLRRAMSLDAKKRHRDAGHLLSSFRRLKSKTKRHLGKARRRRSGDATGRADWRRLRYAEFRRAHRHGLGLGRACADCDGPISEAMFRCPWCGKEIRAARAPVSYPARCPRCGRGRKRDWKFCAWCYGPAFEDVSGRHFTDQRYSRHCARTACRGPLVPFSRYCPWCRAKVKKAWTVPELAERCRRCGWSVSEEFWTVCPWCEEAKGTLT